MDQYNDNALYVVLSGTPYKIGKLIRYVTKYEYNHVSLATDRNLNDLYSFARYRKNAPLYAGFVKESKNRYIRNGKAAWIRVYRIPLSKERYESVRYFLSDMIENRNKYIYNLPSALCAPIKKRLYADKTYTCIEFAVSIMEKFCGELNITGAEYWSIERLSCYLSDYLYYEGEIDETALSDDWGSDVFMEDTGFMRNSVDTVKLVSRATWRVCRTAGMKHFSW